MCRQHETFRFIIIMSLPAMSFGDRFYVNRKGRTGGGGWVHSKGANSMVVSGWHCIAHFFPPSSYVQLG